MRNLKFLAAIAAMTLTGTISNAEGWTLDPAMSNVAFGSIKNDYAGETHHFGDISGTVTDAGAVSVNLALGSVETNIDIRNERMMEYVFDNTPNATVTAQIDMAALNGLDVGGATTTETTGTLSLLGEEIDLDVALFVMRLADDKVMVVTDGMVMLSTEDAGIDAGIGALQEIAGLDSITRVSPVTMRLIFDKDT